MSEFQIFLSLASSFMAAMAHECRLHNRSIARALGEAMKFQAQGVNFGVPVEQAAYEYAYWVTSSASKPKWLPADYRSTFVG